MECIMDAMYRNYRSPAGMAAKRDSDFDNLRSPVGMFTHTGLGRSGAIGWRSHYLLAARSRIIGWVVSASAPLIGIRLGRPKYVSDQIEPNSPNSCSFRLKICNKRISTKWSRKISRTDLRRVRTRHSTMPGGYNTQCWQDLFDWFFNPKCLRRRLSRAPPPFSQVSPSARNVTSHKIRHWPPPLFWLQRYETAH